VGEQTFREAGGGDRDYPSRPSPVRYVLKIHFFIEFGLKMIQFKIQFKTKSKIFIQKKFIQNKIQDIH
jgi:hypothetical protein